MKNKKAQITSTTQDILIGLIAGAVFAVIFFYASNAFGSILQKQKVDCSNSKWWNSERGLKDILKDVDKGEDAEFMLYNDDCNLVSFSFIQGINKIEFPNALTKEPMLCLCKIEDKTCKPYNCHKFKNYEQINTEQFSTENLESYVFLKFEKEGKTLRITAVGTEKTIEPVTYAKQETQTKTDETNLINKMVVRFTSRDIKSFIPIIKIQKEKGLLLPEGIENIEDFTMFFDIDLAYPPSYGQTEEEYLVKHESIDKDKVKEAFIEINIPKDKFNRLTFNQQENINLYYKKEQKWESSDLQCSELDKNILCSTIIKGFSKNFAISAIFGEIEEQETEDEGDLEIELLSTGRKSISVAKTGPCKNLMEDLIPIPQDEKIKCTSVCCAKPETIEHLNRLRESIAPEQSILITDAGRKPESQRAVFLAYLSGRVEACGPKGLKKVGFKDKHELEKLIPNIKASKQQRIEFSLNWLSQNKPETLPIINDLSRYSHCNHINGYALDLQLKKGQKNEDIQELRNLMCSVGWANYGVEWWHYEYLTKNYMEAKNAGKCYFGKDKFAYIGATVTPNYT